MRKITTWQGLRSCLVFVFSLLITLFPSLITQKWWDLWRESLFGFVFKFCFHHLILLFLSDELWKLKTHFRFFQVIETKLWWHFCKYTHIEGPTVRPFTLSNTRHLLFFFFFCLSRWVWDTPFSILFFFFLLFFPILFTSVSMFGYCFFSLFSVFKNNFLFLILKNLFGNSKWTENKNCSQN